MMTISNDLTNDEMVLVYNALVAERKEYKQLASNFFHSDRMGAFYGRAKSSSSWTPLSRRSKA